MVAVRSAHINKAGEFDPEKWIASLGITSQKSCECLAETWAYCLQQTQGHPDASLLLWRGVEMVEIDLIGQFLYGSKGDDNKNSGDAPAAAPGNNETTEPVGTTK